MLSLKDLSSDLVKRAELTTSCRDCDYIPKVEGAGGIFLINGREIQLMHNGLKIFAGCYHGDWMTYIIQELCGHHEPQEEKVFFEVLKHINNNGVMIELGSFWSYYSMWYKKEKDGECHMIEPHRKKLEIGSWNFKLNNMNGTFIHGFIGRTSEANSLFHDWDGKVYEMPRIAVDDYIEKNNIQYVDILHSDIQGAELNMLHGHRDAIAKQRIGYFFISTHGNCHDQILSFLSSKNFHIIVSHTINESVSGDGLIVAAAPHLNSDLLVEVSKSQCAAT